MHTKKHQKGFTLVELIVVITILAILGTIAFFSLRGYNTTARNTVRLDAINKLTTVLSTSKTSGKNILGFTFTGSEVPNAEISGTGTLVGIDYKAGDFNETAFGIKQEDFQDPLTGNKYIVGITSRKNGAYETAATLETGVKLTTKVLGNYTPRLSTPIAGVGNSGSKTFTLSNYSDINMLLQGDYVSGTSLPTGTQIESISKDGTLIRLTNTLTGSTTTISLATDEVEGLILGTGGVNPVVDGGVEIPYGISGSSSSSGGGTTCVFGSGIYGTCTFGS